MNALLQRGQRIALALVLAMPALTAAAEPGDATPDGVAAEGAASDAALQRVEVAGARGTVMPYARWVSAVRPIHELSEGRIRQGVRLFSRDKNRPLRVSVVDEQHSQPVDALLGELFVVPHDLTVDAEQAELSVNRSDGSWGVGNFALVPQLADALPEMASVRQVLRGYQAIYRQRFPLSWRLLSRAEASFDVCSPTAGAHVNVSAPDGRALAQLPLERPSKEHAQTTGLTLYCASVRQDASWGDDARLALPPHAVALLGFRLL